MALTLSERAAVAVLAKHLYSYLPASGNINTSFPLAAQRTEVFEGWPEGRSKEPSIVALLTWIIEQRRGQFCSFIQEVVAQSMTWRGRAGPMTRQEVEELNRLLLGLKFKISELHDAAFLSSLATDPVAGRTPAVPSAPEALAVARFAELEAELMALSALAPQPRGYAFEKFLANLFDAFSLAARGGFRNTGEQIDGSFVLHHDTYLLEAKWQSAPVDAATLRAFAGKVGDKATWSRGLFVSESGFSVDGLEAFGRGQPVVCIDGLDLYETLSRRLSLVDVLAKKVRRAAETGNPFIRVRDLF
ncbi:MULTISPECIES: restriction endonuclease [Rhodanobacter]|uniref:restriction endonuclease n=1 Tax=Rhodanobacter TaxID=75309 RepID=UPI0009DC4770|nr:MULTISPECIES: restriction endonuclease [Rhodanobacter]UJJ53394.1 restriction endonuclease [Rhodanobacter thiooxydans]